MDFSNLEKSSLQPKSLCLNFHSSVSTYIWQNVTGILTTILQTIIFAQIYKETHCITNSFLNHSTLVSSSQFRAGSSSRETGGTVHPASQIVQNPRYDWWNIDFDISVVRVSFGALLQHKFFPKLFEGTKTIFSSIKPHNYLYVLFSTASNVSEFLSQILFIYSAVISQ